MAKLLLHLTGTGEELRAVEQRADRECGLVEQTECLVKRIRVFMTELEEKANVRVSQLCGGIGSMSKALNSCLELVQALGYIKSSDQDGVPGACSVLAITPHLGLN